jgi:hypothetical protein
MPVNMMAGIFVKSVCCIEDRRVFHVYDNIEADIGLSAPTSAAIASTSCRGTNRFTCNRLTTV